MTPASYAPATITYAGPLVHVSGVPGTMKDGQVPSDYESQIHLALLNLRKVIITSGTTVSQIASLTLYIVDYDATKRQHARHLQRFLGQHRPAMTLVPVQKLAAPSWLIEINAVVARPEVLAPPRITPSVQQAFDVVIIGAGLAGLSAANDVRRNGLTCVVLEARDRVGGKTWSQPMESEGARGVFDLGAAWINDTNQSRMYELAKKYGAELIEQNTHGNCALQDFDGKCVPFPYGELPKVCLTLCNSQSWRTYND
ncbi:flavin containing amine oxidoreductase [Colletotrichum tofieldiae]|nr:flavin containing amine oxidoreductase [Colletotrichum tofieldiae]GKT76624.1 flavin containing amine oxidoreductase [Colletotrichum tofieldiae]GKT87676.1 flavin containing amine oxidoreductase [Colletotrichum tofieldiae]